MTDTTTQQRFNSAPLWRRFASMVYDSFLVLALSMAYGALITFIASQTTGAANQGNYTPMVNGAVANSLVFIGWIAVIASFYSYFWYRAGQSTGMRAWRLKVVQADALPEVKLPTLKQSVTRAFLAPFALTLAGAGYWWKFIDSNNDCWHDRFSGTRVVVTAKDE